MLENYYPLKKGLLLLLLLSLPLDIYYVLTCLFCYAVCLRAKTVSILPLASIVPAIEEALNQ